MGTNEWLNSLFTNEEGLQLKVREFILKLLETCTQSGARELLEKVESSLGWQARHEFQAAIRFLRVSPDVRGYLKDYLNTVLSDEEVAAALRGGAKTSQEFRSTVDDLFRRSVLYLQSPQFKEAIQFCAKFRDYAPFNNMLVRVQNPACSFYATEKDWVVRFNRTLKVDARPLLILAPMHPVMLVYDLDSTEGPDLPDEIRNLGQASGDWNPARLDLLCKNAARAKIQVDFLPRSKTQAGIASRRHSPGGDKFRIVVHSELDPPSRYAVLCHELAHIYLGQLGSDADRRWPTRINLTGATVEIEAESVAYIVCTWAELATTSDAYLASLVKQTKIPDSVSLELVSKVAGKLEELSTRLIPERRMRATT